MVRRRRSAQRSNSIDAFTLVEILVVVIIIGVLAATIVPKFLDRIQDAKNTAAKKDIAELETQLEIFHGHMDRYPASEEGLKVLVAPPADGAQKWRGPYLKALRPDPWGNAYLYRSPGQASRPFDLWSRGADGVEGGEGNNKDITSWEEG